MIFQPFQRMLMWNISWGTSTTRRGAVGFRGCGRCYLLVTFLQTFFSSSFCFFLGVFSYVPTWNFSEGWSFFWRFLWLLSGIWREFLVEGNTLGFGGLLCTAVLPWLPWIQSCFFEPEFPIFPCEKAGFGVENCCCHLRTFFRSLVKFLVSWEKNHLIYTSSEMDYMRVVICTKSCLSTKY